MFEDEARFGRISDPRRCWAPPGVRPEVKTQLVREYEYAFAAVCPQDGTLDTLVLPTVNTEAMGLFLAEVRTSRLAFGSRWRLRNVRRYSRAVKVTATPMITAPRNHEGNSLVVSITIARMIPSCNQTMTDAKVAQGGHNLHAASPAVFCQHKAPARCAVRASLQP